jgi:choline dehydrogenase-like flavoprotein
VIGYSRVVVVGRRDGGLRARGAVSEDTSRSVCVDDGGGVLGCENLVVADASIMPTIPRASTTLTTAAIAERIAELL